MKTGAFRLNRDYLMSIAKNRGIENLHQLSKRTTKVSWPTIHNYFTADIIRAINLENLYDLLLNGVGLTDDEIASLNFGDIFIMVDDDSI